MKRARVTLTCIALALVLLLGACGAKQEAKTTVSLDKTSLTMHVGDTAQLTVTASEEGLAAAWTSSDETVATVSGGLVSAVASGTATIKVEMGSASASCVVTVAAPVTSNIVFQEEEGSEGVVTFFFGDTNVDLTKGLTAVDADGKTYRVSVSDDGGFDPNKLGSYTVAYSAGDATFSRTAHVTYYGVDAQMLERKAASALREWSYVPLEESEKTAMEWEQQIVPGHSTNWNRFEGPVGLECIVMHGSDTNGRELGSVEVDDELPNTMLWNKVTVPADSATLRVYCSNNPYPDYNNLLSKMRLSVLDMDTMAITSFDYRQIKAPLNETKDGLDYDTIRSNTYQDFDLSAFAGKTVVVFIEQEAPADTYQWDYYLDIGYLEFQIQPLIAETRDALCVYSMQFID